MHLMNLETNKQNNHNTRVLGFPYQMELRKNSNEPVVERKMEVHRDFLMEEDE